MSRSVNRGAGGVISAAIRNGGVNGGSALCVERVDTGADTRLYY